MKTFTILKADLYTAVASAMQGAPPRLMYAGPIAVDLAQVSAIRPVDGRFIMLGLPFSVTDIVIAADFEYVLGQWKRARLFSDADKLEIIDLCKDGKTTQ